MKTIVGPVAGCAALVTESGRVDFLSVETRQTVGSFTGGIVLVPNTVIGSQDLGATPDGRDSFRLLNANPNETCVEGYTAENNRPLLRLGQLGFAAQQPTISDDRFSRRVRMLGEHGPLAVLSQSGQAMELVDLDVPAVARQVSPQDFHVVSQPPPYVMEGRTFQYAVRVNNPTAVQSLRVQTPTGAALGTDGTVWISTPNTVSKPTCLNIAIEIKGKNGLTLLHEFPVYVLPTPRAGTSAKIGEL